MEKVDIFCGNFEEEEEIWSLSGICEKMKKIYLFLVS